MGGLPHGCTGKCKGFGMAEGAFVAYYRVSTERQGRSGLGLEAQRKAVEDFLNGGNWRLVAEFTEIESGKHSDRPALAKAFQACRLRRAKLVIAKLDRLSRDAHFLLGRRKLALISSRLTCRPRTGSRWGSWRWSRTRSGASFRSARKRPLQRLGRGACSLGAIEARSSARPHERQAPSPPRSVRGRSMLRARRHKPSASRESEGGHGAPRGIARGDDALATLPHGL